MFNKAENLKHYQKIAEAIVQVNPNYEVTILKKSHHEDPRELLTIRVVLNENRMHEFWIADGCWVFAAGAYRKGKWDVAVGPSPIDFLGELLDFGTPPSFETLAPLFPEATNWRLLVNALFRLGPLMTAAETEQLRADGHL